MSIEIGSKWVKDGEVVEVKSIEDIRIDKLTLIWFMHSIKTDYMPVLTERDFLEQYKPYKTKDTQ